MVVADSTDDQGGATGITNPLRDPGSLQHAYGQDQHDPTIHDTQSPHVDLTGTPTPARGSARPSSPRPEGRPRLPRILTDPPPELGNPDEARTPFFTPGASGEVGDSQLFDSTENNPVSGPSSHDIVGSARRLIVVHRLTDEWAKTKHPFPIQPLELPRGRRSSRRPDQVPQDQRNSKAVDVDLGHGLGISLTQPSQNARRNSDSKGPERPRDSRFSSLSSLSNEFRSDAGPSKPTLEPQTSTIPGRESGTQHRSKLPGRDGGNSTGSTKETKFPRQNGKRVVPKWSDAEGRSEEKRREERDDASHLSTDCTSVPNGIEGQFRDRTLTSVSPTRAGTGRTTQDGIWILIQRSTPAGPSRIRRLLTKLHVRECFQLLRSSSPRKRVLTQAQKDTPAVETGRDRERTMSGFSSLASLQSWSTGTRKDGNKRGTKPHVTNIF